MQILTPRRQDRKYIVIRLDDICDTMNLDNFMRLKNILDEYDIKPLIGVIPDNKDPKLAPNIAYKDYDGLITKCIESGWMVAMHGVHHQYNSRKKGLVTNRKDSEFSGLNFDEQMKLIAYGKELLNNKGIETKIFFAPAHSYDSNTIRALYNQGFRIISDGRTNKPYERQGIKFIPVRYFTDYIRPRGMVTTWCFHANNMTDEDFDRTKEHIRKYRDCIVDYCDVIDIKGYTLGAMGYIDERLFLFYEYYIHPVLSKIKHLIVRRPV